MTDTLTPSTVAPLELERRLVTAIPGPRSIELQERRRRVVSDGVSSALPVFIQRAHGAILVDVDGNQFIDLGAGIGVTTIGHTDDAVVAAASAQLADVTHTLFTITPYEEYVRVAELLAEHTPGAFAKKTVLVNSGPRPSRTASRSPANTRAAPASPCSSMPTTGAPTSRWP
jgi:4-aminobutyrate aminotransferase/(S)-3-amino-2-methylpropionate transaminase